MNTSRKCEKNVAGNAPINATAKSKAENTLRHTQPGQRDSGPVLSATEPVVRQERSEFATNR